MEPATSVFSATTLSPIVEALSEAISVTDIVNLFTSGVTVALPLILVWFGARWVKYYDCSSKSVLTLSNGVIELSIANGENKKFATPC